MCSKKMSAAILVVIALIGIAKRHLAPTSDKQHLLRQRNKLAWKPITSSFGTEPSHTRKQIIPTKEQKEALKQAETMLDKVFPYDKFYYSRDDSDQE